MARLKSPQIPGLQVRSPESITFRAILPHGTLAGHEVPPAFELHDPKAAGGEDEVNFLDEDGDSGSAGAAPLVVLIVDDDRDVHDTTLMALRGEKVQGRHLQFLHAYSAAEARQVLAANRHVVLILLDVVMETPDAGLNLVPTIRDELGMSDVKIILRTGQPGYAPEAFVMQNFPIDGYLMKAKLTRAMLFAAVARTLGDSSGTSEGDGPH